MSERCGKHGWAAADGQCCPVCNAKPAMMSWGGGLVPIDSGGMRMVIDAHSRLANVVRDMFTILDECSDSEDWREWVARWRVDAEGALGR